MGGIRLLTQPADSPLDGSIGPLPHRVTRRGVPFQPSRARKADQPIDGENDANRHYDSLPSVIAEELSHTQPYLTNGHLANLQPWESQ